MMNSRVIPTMFPYGAFLVRVRENPLPKGELKGIVTLFPYGSLRIPLVDAIEVVYLIIRIVMIVQKRLLLRVCVQFTLYNQPHLERETPTKIMNFRVIPNMFPYGASGSLWLTH